MNNAPPAPDELEVSLFGPGYGECVVVHLGANEWMVVDSCLNPETGLPAALEYFQALGIDPGNAVKLVAMTHWHDDHMRGAAKVFDQSHSARLACSLALRHPDFFTLVAAADQARGQDPSRTGLSEFAALLACIQRRTGKAGPEGVKWALADRVLFSRTAGLQPECEVVALAPSDASVTSGLLGLAARLPKAGERKRTIVTMSPNETSIVLLVRVGAAVALLGADLEIGKDALRGWCAVVTDSNSSRPKASIYKVAHHGSSNADHAGIWSGLLSPDPTAAMSPFWRGSVSLPSDTDVTRLRAQAGGVFCSASRRAPGPGQRPRAVEKTIREVAKEFRPRTGKLGQVRVRVRDGDTRVDLKRPAQSL